MKIEDFWPRIAGIHYAADGTLAAVWLAHDAQTDRVRAYDCARFDRAEVLEVIAAGLNTRGKWIPIAWPESAKPLADKLLYDYGCRMLPEFVNDDPATADVTSREIWARMRSSRFTFNDALVELRAEYESFRRDESEIPAHPLMAALRHATSCLSAARAKTPLGKGKLHYPKTSIV